MSAKAEPEPRLLNASELEMVSFTQYPAIEQLPIEQLKAVGRRLRQAHVRAKDISARQQREIRGKVEPRGVNPTRDNSGTMAKAQVLHVKMNLVGYSGAIRVAIYSSMDCPTLVIRGHSSVAKKTPVATERRTGCLS